MAAAAGWAAVSAGWARAAAGLVRAAAGWVRAASGSPCPFSSDSRSNTVPAPLPTPPGKCRSIMATIPATTPLLARHGL